MAKRGGRFCVAGGPNNISCTNCNYTPGISMHIFPKDERTRMLWTHFVRRHRPNFSPSPTSALCSVHFEQRTCYTRLSLSTLQPEDTESIKEKRILEKGSIPTIDTAITAPMQQESPRERRRSKKFLRDIRGKASPSARDTCTESESDESDEFPADRDEGEASEIETEDGAHVEGSNSVNKYAQTEMEIRVKSTQTGVYVCQKCNERKEKLRQLQKQNSRLRSQKDHWKNTALKLQQGDSDHSSEAAEGEKDQERMEIDGHEEEGSSEPEDELEDLGEEETLDNDDPDWAGLEERGADDDEGDDQEQDKPSSYNVNLDDGTPVQSEPKFIVFYTRLLAIFSLFCFNCKEGSPEVKMKNNGTMVTVAQNCRNCGPQSFLWRSQPLVLGRYPAGNLLLSFGVLMAGASVTKVLLVMHHMGLCVYSTRTYFLHQSKFLFPAILSYWESYRASLLSKLKDVKDAVWSGDGRFDSMGHSAKYGAYTMLCCTLSKIVHFELIQANQVKSSNDMELKGAQDCFKFLKQAGLSIAIFISDRHRSVAKWIREHQPSTQHFFDIWHVAKSITKKLQKAGKESGCERIMQWQKSIKNHLHWCAISTKVGFGDLILAKWKSVIGHMCNKHDNHPDPLFKKCVHGLLAPRFWIKIGTHIYDKIKKILMDVRLLNDIKRLSSEDQTSSLEGFHSTLNQFHPKMICFSWLGTFCRHVLASLHFNENVHRETITTRDGKERYQVTYPKYKFGEELVREIRVPPTYKYVDDLKKLVFSMRMTDRKEVLARYKNQTPTPLNTRFPDRVNKADAVANYTKRKQQQTSLCPSAEDQELLHAQASSSSASRTTKKRKPPTCRTCKQPLKGHPKNGCHDAANES